MYVDIDRAIEVLKNCTNGTDRQIAAWLEELKAYKQKPEGWMWDEAEQKGYNKAIDDLSNILKENYDYLPQILSQKAFDGYIDEYAEQLKAGVSNENNS